MLSIIKHQPKRRTKFTLHNTKTQGKNRHFYEAVISYFKLVVNKKFKDFRYFQRVLNSPKKGRVVSSFGNILRRHNVHKGCF